MGVDSGFSAAAGGVAGDSFLRGRVILGALIGTSISTVWLALSQNYNSLLFGKVLHPFQEYSAWHFHSGRAAPCSSSFARFG
jgi:hypothetical protein